MKKTLFILMLIVLLVINITIAEEQSLAPHKKDSCVMLRQSCANCTSINFTTIISPTSEILATNLQAQKSGTDYNYSFCNTSEIGRYTVQGVGDVDGIATVFAYDFEINPSGRDSNLSIAMGISVVIIVLILIIFGSFLIYYAEGPLKFVALLGTMLLIVFGTNLLANMATDSNMSETVINLLWVIYKMFLYGFFAMFFFILAKLITMLRIQKNPPPRIDSPLKLVKAQRKERKNRNKYTYRY